MRRRKVEEKERNRAFSTKAKHSSKCCRDRMATDAIALSLAKKVGSSSIAGTGRAYSNGGSREDKCSCGELKPTGRIHA